MNLYRVACIFYPFLTLIALLSIAARDPRGVLALFGGFFQAPLSLALGLASSILLLLLWHWGRRYLGSMQELEGLLSSMLRDLGSRRIWVLALLSGLGEEVFFRGALQPSLGLVLASMIFALLHLQPGKVLGPWTIFALVAGLLMGALSLWRGDILAATTAHVLVNRINLGRLASEGSRRRNPGEPCKR